jgi:hypothetical protein
MQATTWKDPPHAGFLTSVTQITSAAFFGLYNEIRKVDDKIKICFLTAANDVYYEGFRKEAFPHVDENFIIQKPIENELLLEKIGSIIKAL